MSNQPQALTAIGDPLFGSNAHQRVERERAEAWSWFNNGGGGSIDYFDGHTWDRMVGQRIENEREAARQRGR
jgi:hypothetical protein